MRLRERLTKLEELEGDAFKGEAVWLVLEPGETAELGIARWEVENGPRQPGQRAIIWHPIETGVPRGAESVCR